MTTPSRASRVLSGIASNFAVKAITFVLTLLSTRLMVAAYGDDRYGVLLLSGLLLGYFSLVGMGIPSGVVKFVAEFRGKSDQDSINRVVSSAFAFYLGIGSVVALAVCAFALFGLGWFRIKPEDIDTARRILLISGVWAIFAWPIQLYGQVLMGLQEWVAFNKAVGVQAVLANVAYVVVAWLRVPIEWASVALIATQILMWWMTRSQVRRTAPELRISLGLASWATVLKVTNYSIWIMLMTLAGLLIFQTQSVIAGIFLSTAAITAFSIASTPLNAIREINSRVLTTLLPAVSEAQGARDHGFISALVLRGSRLNMAAIATLGAIGIGTAEVALKAWMGPNYGQYADVTRILLLGYCVSAGYSVIGQALIGMNHVRLIASFAIVGGFISILASLALVDRIGLMGLAWGNALPSLVFPFLVTRLYLNRLGVGTLEFLRAVLLPNFVSMTLVAGMAWWCSQMFLSQPATGLIPSLGFLTIVTLAAFAIPYVIVFKDEDRQKVHAMLGRLRRIGQ